MQHATPEWDAVDGTAVDRRGQSALSELAAAEDVPAGMPALMAELVRIFGAPRPAKHEPLTVEKAHPRKVPANPEKGDSKPPKAASPPAEQPDRALDVERCEPRFFFHRNLTVTGFLRELLTGRTIGDLATTGTVGHVTYRNVLGTETKRTAK